MQRMPYNLLNAFQRSLMVVVAVCFLPVITSAQERWGSEGWLHSWQNQPSGEFAPDYRRADPLKPLLSDADKEAYEARKPPSFLDRFSSSVTRRRSEESDASLVSHESIADAEYGEETLSESAAELEFYDDAADYGQIESVIPSMPLQTPQSVFSNTPVPCHDCYSWQVLPKGLMYRSYMAGEKEPRMQFVQLHDSRSDRRVWEAVLGGRVGLLRKGTCDALKPEGFQLDLEGAVFARVLPDEPSAMLEGSDFRVGLLGTNRYGGTAIKYGYYHISSHAGDEFLLANLAFTRLNYVRDSLIAGITQDVGYATQVYGEIAYAMGTQGGAEPWECQFGAQYLPVAKSSLRGAPYVAANYHIRQEFGTQGGFNTVAGWGWQGPDTGHRLRVGFQYYNGPSLNYQLFDRIENLYGGGIWFDY